MDKWLVLVNLRLGSETNAYFPGVKVNCIMEGEAHRHVLLDPQMRLTIPIKSSAGTTRSESVGLARWHAVAPVPCRLWFRTPCVHVFFFIFRAECSLH